MSELKRSTWVSVLVAGGLLVAGCSSGSGAAASLSTPASSSAVSVPATTTASASSAAPAAGSDSATASVPPAVLDSQTTAWFQTVCSGLGPSIASLNSLDQTTDNPAAQQSAAVTALQTLQSAFTSTATALASAPSPTFDGGSQFASKLTTGLQSSADQLGPVAAKFAAVDSSNAAALSAAASGLQTDLNTALEPLSSIDQLDPAVSEAVSAIPACESLGN